MGWGIPGDVFLQFHVAVSLIAIASGLVVLYDLVAAKPLAGWTVLFLATTILTGVTGFPLAPFGLDPPRVVGIILLVLMAAAVVGLYVFHLARSLRWLYFVPALLSLSFHC